jgi:GR25 family glycosyltransferase involved in LPS biosynthesis
MYNKMNIIIILIIILFLITKFYKQENFKNNYNIKVIYINLEKDKDRNKKMIKTLKENNIKYYRKNAVYGKNLNINNIDNRIIDSIGLEDIKNKNYKFGLSLTMGGIGCAISHYEIIKNISEDKDNNNKYIILEDDINFQKNLISNIQKVLKSAPNNWDIIYIGYGPISDDYKNKKINYNFYKTNRVHGTFGYILNKKGAKKILNLFPIKYQIDTALYLASRNNKINSYIYKPQLIFHYDYSSTNIQVNPNTLQDDNI